MGSVEELKWRSVCLDKIGVPSWTGRCEGNWGYQEKLPLVCRYGVGARADVQVREQYRRTETGKLSKIIKG